MQPSAPTQLQRVGWGGVYEKGVGGTPTQDVVERWSTSPRPTTRSFPCSFTSFAMMWGAVKDQFASPGCRLTIPRQRGSDEGPACIRTCCVVLVGWLGTQGGWG